MLLLTVLVGCIYNILASKSRSTITALPNSCINHEDTDNLLIQPVDDDNYPALNVACSNEYMIVDVSKDSNWLKYFSTQRDYHYALIGPEKDDHSNWKEWIAFGSQSSFLVSPDCSLCDIDHELNHLYGSKSSYYMTPVTNGCTQLPIGRIGCDMNYYSYECHICQTSEIRVAGYWSSERVFNGLNDAENTKHFLNEVENEAYAKYGLCGFTIRDADAYHDPSMDTFRACKTVTHEDVLSEKIMPRRKPSLGTDGRFCQCIKPDTLQYHDVDSTSLNTIKKESKTDEETETEVEVQPPHNDIMNEDRMDIYYLSQDDFKYGTYRIRKSGKYILTEDIVFDFKAPRNWEDGGLATYNGAKDWYPTIDQIDEYPGAGDLKNSYFLGFWAGITIETNDVILEMNNKKLSMSQAFYYQQSFFALISLTSQIFLPGQGPGFFGGNPQSGRNVIVRNGELGLSSHHGIQGNFNENILISNLKIYDFKTHGIQFNGFHSVTIKDVDIGNNMIVDKLTPYYSHMRHLLGLYRIMSDNEDILDTIKFNFYGRDDDDAQTFNEYINDIQLLLDMSFEYAIFDGKEPSATDTDNEYKYKLWNENRDVLVNNHINPQTATLYGIFLNYVGSNVIGWYAGSESTKSYNAELENVNVHDLYHNTYENLGFSQGEDTASQRILNCLNAPFNAEHVFGAEQLSLMSKCNTYYSLNSDDDECQNIEYNYHGNKIVDIQLISFKLINEYGLSWNYCSAGAADLFSLVDFAFDNKQFAENTPLLVGTHDPMIHPGKGVLGIRFNGVDNVKLNKVSINNIHSATKLGSYLSGEYETAVSQQLPYMKGFTMNMVNGLSTTFSKHLIFNNVRINNIISDTGLSYGTAIWYETDVKVIGDGLIINNVFAGHNLEPDSDKYSIDTFPYLAPEGCAIRIYDDPINEVTVDYDNNINIQCISGHTGCTMNDDLYSHVGDVKECDTATELFISTTLNNNNNNNTIYITIITSIFIISALLIWTKTKNNKIKNSSSPNNNNKDGYGTF